MTDLTPAKIIADAPLGAIIRFSDGTPRPPERFRTKLAAWENNNGVGMLTEVQREHGTFTLHLGDHGSGEVIVLRMYRTYDIRTALAFRLERMPAEGTVLCANVWRGNRKIEKATSPGLAARWLENNRYGELLSVGAGGALTVIHAARELA